MFKTSNELCLHIEKLKKDQNFDSYTDAVLHFIEYESDHEVEQVVKHLNAKIIEHIRGEAEENNSIKSEERINLLDV